MSHLTSVVTQPFVVLPLSSPKQLEYNKSPLQADQLLTHHKRPVFLMSVSSKHYNKLLVAGADPGGGGGGGALGAEAPPSYLINMLSIIMKFCLSIII